MKRKIVAKFKKDTVEVIIDDSQEILEGDFYYQPHLKEVLGPAKTDNGFNMELTYANENRQEFGGGKVVDWL